jgi:hypothetical protein
MKLRIAFILLACPLLAQDITFTNKTATFTNLAGQVFRNVQLLRGDWDGVIWRDGASGGRICYTNLDPLLLEAWGIPTKRISIALARSEHRSVSEARYRHAKMAEARAQLAAKQKAKTLAATDAALKAFAEQRKADAQAISSLRQQIVDGRVRLLKAQATQGIPQDGESSNLYSVHTPFVFVTETEWLTIAQAEARLEKKEADFALKYTNH